MKCFIFDQVCKHRITDEGPVFMVSQFGFPFDDLFELGIKKAINRIGQKRRWTNHVSEERSTLSQSDFAIRADLTIKIGSVMCQRICRNIMQAKYVIADVSLPNLNVYYEIGLALSLNKKIILIYNKDCENPYREKLLAFFPKGAVIAYSSIDELDNDKLFEEAIEGCFCVGDKRSEVGDKNLFAYGKDESSFISNEDGVGTIMCLVNGEAFSQVLFKNASGKGILNDVIEKVNKQKQSKWNIQSLPLTKETDVEKVVNCLCRAKVCIVDVSIYKTISSPNPFMFLYFGFCHGFERVTIPITNTELSGNDIPFDILGLYQIQFKRLTELHDTLFEHMDSITRDYLREQEDYWNRIVWKKFAWDIPLHIVTCARRDINKDKDRKGGRTTIDMWDYKAVTKLSLFLGQLFPSARIRISEPIIKEIVDSDEKKIRMNNQVYEYLSDKNLLVVGSPDVSDYGEVLLAKMHGIQPYSKKTSIPVLEQQGFFFVKKTHDKANHRHYSSFFVDPKDGIEKIHFFDGSRSCFEDPDGENWIGEAHGILSIGQIPYVKNLNGNKTVLKRTICVISGFTGIATYGVVRLLSDSMSHNDDFQGNVFKKQIRELTEKLVKHKNDERLDILFKINYKRPKFGGDNIDDTKDLSSWGKSGDLRQIVNISFEKIIAINTPAEPLEFNEMS